MVWTSETGIWEVAMELRMCPAREKRASGRAVVITGIDGGRIPFLRAGTLVFKIGNRDAR
jgi:hypothetical protein